MILVTGATGLVGGAVVHQLAEQGVPVRALVRSAEKGAALAGPTHGVLPAAMQEGRIAMVDARDVAAVAVAALTAPGHAGQTYVITGPEALSHAMVAAILSEAAGRPIVYRDIALDAFRAQLG